MKRTNHFLMFIFSLAIILVLCVKPGNKVQESSSIRAAKGDTVWVVIYSIKPDKREQFENFFNVTFLPQFDKLTLNEQRAKNQTRMLYPVKANEDGTYTYVLFMDPVVTGADYSIESCLEKIYGKEKAKEYTKTLEQTFSKPGIKYDLIQ